MTSPSKPYIPTTPTRKNQSPSGESASSWSKKFTGFEETPYSIKKKRGAAVVQTAPGGTQLQLEVDRPVHLDQPEPSLQPRLFSPTKHSPVKSPSKLRMMSTNLVNNNDDDDDDDGYVSPSPSKKAPRTPSKPRVLRNREELNQSARKRAYQVLMDSRNGDESVDESEVELAEKIIEESYEDDGDNDDEYIPQKKRTIASTSSSPHRSATSSSRQSEKSPSAPPPKKPRKQAARSSTTATSSTSASTNGELSDEDFKGTDDMAALFLDGYEGYFDQHKTREKISTTPFSRAPAIEFSEFISYVDQSRGYFKDSKDFLTSLYRTMFTQWFFELSQGYSLLYYGIGSKRNLLLEFVTSTIPESVPVLVVNGYNPATNFKELLNSLIHILVDDSVTKLPKNTPDLLQTVVQHLDSKRKSQTRSPDFVKLKLPKVVILIHNIDGESLRSDKSQSYLSTLASIPEVWLVASSDHINAPVMWDAAKLALYNFLWHDLTTYDSYAVETSFEDPLSLGKIRTAAGNKGVKYVLSSLTLKARGLYRVLICHQIETMTNELHGTGNIEDQRNTPGSLQFGIEFKLLYQKCVEEFLVSNELNFRTMLTEFLDHKMAVLTKDSSGTEIVYVPYTKETIENILEQDLID
jgi:origin recognition complex subunit 2